MCSPFESRWELLEGRGKMMILVLPLLMDLIPLITTRHATTTTTPALSPYQLHAHIHTPSLHLVSHPPRHIHCRPNVVG
jgi:hypothetical protein